MIGIANLRYVLIKVNLLLYKIVMKLQRRTHSSLVVIEELSVDFITRQKVSARIHIDMCSNDNVHSLVRLVLSTQFADNVRNISCDLGLQ